MVYEGKMDEDLQKDVVDWSRPDQGANYHLEPHEQGEYIETANAGVYESTRTKNRVLKAGVSMLGSSSFLIRSPREAEGEEHDSEAQD